MKNKTKALTLIFTFCLYAIFSFGQIKESAAIDSLFADWNKPNVPGCAVGVMKDGELIFAKGYGMANLEYDIPNSPSSVFRIASTSKQFTAACIVLLAEQGKLKLEDPLSTFFPDFPSYADQITVRHLLNHTSGIRDYLSLAGLKGLRNDDYYTDEEIMEWLTQQTDLNFKPGEEHLYSNSGYWLLGQIVNEVAEMNMADFAQKELFEPLGMKQTHFHNDHNQIVKNRATGYYPNGKESFEISMTTLEMIGDGGIFTCINDIKKWDDAYYKSEILSNEFWSQMTQRGVLNNGDTIDYASGLMIDKYKGLDIVLHGGAFVGFRAEIIRFPDQHFSVVIFTNRGDANPTRKCFGIAKLFLKDQFIPEKKKEKKKVKKAIASESTVELPLAQLPGNYEIEPGVNLKVFVQKDTLTITQSWNKETYPIARIKENQFQIPDDASLTFTFSGLKEGKASILTVLQGGSETICKRIETVDLSKINLKDYSGDYYSNELDVTYRIIQDGADLKLKVGNNKSRKLNVYKIDELLYRNQKLKFRRTNNQVEGFTLDAGRVKNVKFEKR